jgi:hypothetical protein
VVTIAVGVALVAFCVLTVRLFIYPDLNAPVRSDAIVVLGGNGLGPPDEGVKLAKEGYAPNLVFSLVPTLPCAVGAFPVPHVRVSCFRADPQSTRGEAHSIAHLAAQHHWHRIIVVMPVSQATRARLRIGRCYAGQILEVGVPPPDGVLGWAYEIVYEWGALMKALVLQPTC